MNEFRARAARAAARAAGLCEDDDAGQYARIANAVIGEFARPTEAMIDAALEAARHGSGEAASSREEFIRAVKAMVRATLV